MRSSSRDHSWTMRVRIKHGSSSWCIGALRLHRNPTTRVRTGRLLAHDRRRLPRHSHYWHLLVRLRLILPFGSRRCAGVIRSAPHFLRSSKPTHAQIIARAFSGTPIKPNPRGWEIGSTELTLTALGREVLGGLPENDGDDKMWIQQVDLVLYLRHPRAQES